MTFIAYPLECQSWIRMKFISLLSKHGSMLPGKLMGIAFPEVNGTGRIAVPPSEPFSTGKESAPQGLMTKEDSV